ncbi:MAG: SEC-C metal-binding domain-containing protein [Mycobacteriales bacterium]
MFTDDDLLDIELTARDHVAAAEEILRFVERPDELDDVTISDLLVAAAGQYGMAKRWDDALAVLDRASALPGGDGVLGQTWRAMTLWDAGRRNEAIAEFERVHDAAPNDFKVQELAADFLVGVDEPLRALPFTSAALRLALAQDADLWHVSRLARWRREAREWLGQAPDALDEEAAAALNTAEPAERTSGPVLVGLVYWPAAERTRLLADFPELAEGMTRDDDEYLGALERELATYATEVRVSVSPFTVDGFLEWAAREGRDPAGGDARAGYAAELAQLGRATPWPPGRNAPCWCGSGVKYKKCCLPRGR